MLRLSRKLQEFRSIISTLCVKLYDHVLVTKRIHRGISTVTVPELGFTKMIMIMVVMMIIIIITTTTTTITTYSRTRNRLKSTTVTLRQCYNTANLKL